MVKEEWDRKKNEYVFIVTLLIIMMKNVLVFVVSTCA